MRTWAMNLRGDAMSTADNELSDIWAVLAPMFSCITYDADGWWAHVKSPQREWNGFDKPALSRQLSGLLRMPLCGSEKIYERPIQKSPQGTSTTDDDDAGSTEYWRDVKAAVQAKRSRNRDDSAELLRASGIEFSDLNGGAHLFVRGYAGDADFWPGTGLWRMRGSTQRHRGVRQLIRLMTPPEDSA